MVLVLFYHIVINMYTIQKLCCDIYSTFVSTSSFQRQLSQDKGSTLAGSHNCRLKQTPQWLHIKVTSVWGSCFMFKRTHALQFNLVLISADTASHFVQILQRKMPIMESSLSCGIIKNFQTTDLKFGWTNIYINSLCAMVNNPISISLMIKGREAHLCK